MLVTEIFVKVKWGKDKELTVGCDGELAGVNAKDLGGRVEWKLRTIGWPIPNSWDRMLKIRL